MKPPSEAEFLKAVLALARLRGWVCLHVRPARTNKGWRTPLQGDGVGFPDLLCVRPNTGSLLVAELKSDRGRLTPEQQVWLDAFHAAGVEAHIWRPKAWKLIERALE